jgi:hypothetical protein
MDFTFAILAAKYYLTAWLLFNAYFLLIKRAELVEMAGHSFRLTVLHIISFIVFMFFLYSPFMFWWSVAGIMVIVGRMWVIRKYGPKRTK